MNIFEIIEPSKLKSKEEIFSNRKSQKQICNSVEDLFKPQAVDYYDLILNIAANLDNEMKDLIDYVESNISAIIYGDNVKQVLSMLIKVDDKYLKCCNDVKEYSEKDKNDDIFILWKHYQYELNFLSEKLSDTADKLKKMHAVHTRVIGKSIVSEYDMSEYEKKICIGSIALMQIYQGIAIDAIDIKKLLSKYGHTNKQTFVTRYEKLKSQYRRIRDKNFENSCNEIMELVDASVKKKIEADLKEARAVKKQKE